MNPLYDLDVLRAVQGHHDALRRSSGASRLRRELRHLRRRERAGPGR